MRALGLGGGYFRGGAAALYGALGVAAAVAGGWLPARAAQKLAPAQALKGLGSGGGQLGPAWSGPALMAAGALLALAPPIGGLPIGAYVAVALLLVGGIACVPAGVGALLRLVRPPSDPSWLLAVSRAKHLRSSATVAVAGVVASLSLAVALTVMVASFREAVSQWLLTVLPADLYVRTASGGSGVSRDAEAAAWLPADFVDAALQQRLRALARARSAPGDGADALLEFAQASEIRATSLRIFDRSFAVTYWLQAVAIGIGLFGIAASFSAQVLARRKEFGLLAPQSTSPGRRKGNQPARAASTVAQLSIGPPLRGVIGSSHIGTPSARSVRRQVATS